MVSGQRQNAVANALILAHRVTVLARLGLAIQIANQTGLRLRLDRIDCASAATFASAASRVAWARENFSSSSIG